MSQITIQNLTFAYGGNEPLFDHASFTLDSAWRLGLIGRNGRGKTTLLKLLMGELPYTGVIAASVSFALFPFAVPPALMSQSALTVARALIAPYDAWEAQMAKAAEPPADMDAYSAAYDAYTAHDGFIINEMIEKDVRKLGVTPEALTRPFATLSDGERAKVQLSALFLRKNAFLLIDEPTDHLDAHGREALADYLASKRGFILVSHDRAFLDATIDHVLSINKSTITVTQGNFTTWHDNKLRQDQFELDQNDKLHSEIKRLSKTAGEKAGWSDTIERGKIGTHVADRGYVGHMAAKMMQRAKAIEMRAQRAVAEKEALLHDLDTSESIKLVPLAYRSEQLLEVRDLSIAYGDRAVVSGLSFSVLRGERVALTGPNGCGKSSLIKLLLGQDIPHEGTVRMGSGLTLSYVPQRTDHLTGSLRDYLRARQLDETLVKSLLRKLDFPRAQFDAPLDAYSAGQRKKLLLAASLSTSAHLYLWDEPLNYVDVLSRMQLEALLLTYQPTLIFVEHDKAFGEKIATKIVRLG